MGPTEWMASLIAVQAPACSPIPIPPATLWPPPIKAGGFAGFFLGDVDVDGDLSKAGGSFKIDHPLDPANKYLYHSFVESPDMMNIYNGNVTTDAEGKAVG